MLSGWREDEVVHEHVSCEGTYGNEEARKRLPDTALILKDRVLPPGFPLSPRVTKETWAWRRVRHLPMYDENGARTTRVD